MRVMAMRDFEYVAPPNAAALLRAGQAVKPMLRPRAFGQGMFLSARPARRRWIRNLLASFSRERNRKR